MPLNYFDDLLQIVVRVLVVVKSIRQLFEGLEEAVQVHLVVVAAPDNILVDDVIVSLHDVTVSQTRVL